MFRILNFIQNPIPQKNSKEHVPYGELRVTKDFEGILGKNLRNLSNIKEEILNAKARERSRSLFYGWFGFSLSFAILLSILSITSSCIASKPAKITIHRGVSFDKGYYSSSEGSGKISKNGENSKRVDGENLEVIGKYYNKIKVQEGDNLYSVSKRHNIPLVDLIEENRLEPPYKLQTGQELTMPNKRYYTVQEGDNLYYIARVTNVAIDDIVSLNNLQKPYDIKVGDRLKLPNKTDKNSANADQHNDIVRDAELPAGNAKGFIWPINGSIISKFGPKEEGLYNDGINIKPNSDKDIVAIDDGVIAYVGNELRGYGNLAIVKHDGGWISIYGHCEKVNLKRNDKVRKGDKIGIVGATGNVQSPQLYFGLRYGKKAVDPEKYLKK